MARRIKHFAHTPVLILQTIEHLNDIANQGSGSWSVSGVYPCRREMFSYIIMARVGGQSLRGRYRKHPVAGIAPN